jgi:carbon-monoxide dehydrogenase large subunit
MPVTDDMQAIEKFGIGQPVLRVEDPVLVRGEGRYIDDERIEGQVYAAFVRSQVAHGRFQSIDTTAARAMKGVLAVYTQSDLEAAGFGDVKSKFAGKHRDGSAYAPPPRPSMARGKVRFVGEIIATVIARTAWQAQDAAEAVVVDLEMLPAVTTTAAALLPGAPQLYDEVPGNLALDYHAGDTAKVAAAFAGAAHVVKLALRNQRLVVNPLEPRGMLIAWDGRAKRFEVRASTQGVKGLQATLAGDVLNGADAGAVRVLTGNVGGSFGMKIFAYPEYACLMHAARVLGKPVKWTDTRSGAFVSDFHGRDQDRIAELALDAQGHFLAVRLSGAANIGAYSSAVGPMSATINALKNVQSVYRTPLIEVSTKVVMTNTAPIGPYRGAGRPEGNYFMERLIEAAARQTGIDSITLRRRNHIRPRQLPFKTASGMTYDSGDFPGMLTDALTAADWKGFARRKRASARRGMLRGIGIGQFLEVTAPMSKEFGGIRFGADGMVTILSGTMDFGMGHHTTFAQVVSQHLGVPIEKIRLVQGDSDEIAVGGGSGGSRSMQVAAQAFGEASALVIEKGRRAAAHLLEAGIDDIAFARGYFSVVGTDKGIGIIDLALRLAAERAPLPDGVPHSLDTDHISNGVEATFPNGCHIAEVEIDPETGVTQVVRYVAVGDCGTIVNPMVVEGQVQGGVAQGIGQALGEETVYDDEGQLLTGSFMDYCMPRADGVPMVEVIHRPSPATTNELGVKGVGEAGCAGSLPAVMNAVVDALAPLGIGHVDMPATPSAIAGLIRTAAAGAKSRQ